MNKIAILLFLFTTLNSAIGQVCTFEQFIPYYPEFDNRMQNSILKTHNNEFVFITQGGIDTTNPGIMIGANIQMVRTDSCGNIKWKNTFGLSDANSVSDIVETTTHNFMITARYNYENCIRILKVDKNGNLVFQKKYLSASNIEDAVSYNITKLADTTYLISGYVKYWLNPNAPSFILRIDDNGNILNYYEYWQKFKFNSMMFSYIEFTRALNDTSAYAVFSAAYETYDTSFYYWPDTHYTVRKTSYNDYVIAFLNTDLSIAHYFNLTDLVADSIEVMPDDWLEITPANDSILFISGESLFKDFKTAPPTKRPLPSSAFLSVTQRKILSRVKFNFGVPPPKPLCFGKDLVSLYTNSSDSGYIIKDVNFNIIKEIIPTPPLKLSFTRGAVQKPFGYMNDDFSLVLFGSSNHRKIKASYYDSITGLGAFAHEMYLVKIDSNGYFTPNTWNAVNELKENMNLWNVFPNPTSDELNIELSNGIYDMELYNLTGKLMYKEQHKRNLTKIDMRHLNEGAYLLKVRNTEDGKVFTQKIIKQ